MRDAIRLDASDGVATATRPLEVGVEVEGVVTRALIPAGHKIALRDHAPGEEVRKYAQVIGVASQPIAAGDHVHTHNLAFVPSEHDYAYGTDLRPAEPAGGDTFMGYRRDGGAIERNLVSVSYLTRLEAEARADMASAEAALDTLVG